MKRIWVLLFGLLFSAPVWSETADLNLIVVDEHILPGYRQLEKTTAELNEQTKAFCAKPDKASMEQLQSAFSQSLAAWQSIQHIRFGPVDFQLRMHRYQMWPDKRSKVAKHLRKRLAEKNSDSLQPQAFQQTSIATQGFSAMERLLFGKTVAISDFIDVDSGTYRCKLLQAIGSNLAVMSVEIVKEWTQGEQPFRNVIATAAQGNGFFESEREVGGKILNNLYTQLQLIVDLKLDLPLGKSVKKAKGKRAELWRSSSSIANIRNNLIGLQQLYQVGFAPRVKDAALKQQIDAAFKSTLAATDKIAEPLLTAVKNPDSRVAVEQLRAEASKLKGLFARELPKAVDLPLGFNSLDGD